MRTKLSGKKQAKKYTERVYLDEDESMESIETKLDTLNDAIENVINIYENTSSPNIPPTYKSQSFDKPKPTLPPNSIPLFIRVLIFFLAFALGSATKGLAILVWLGWKISTFVKNRKELKRLNEKWEQERLSFIRDKDTKSLEFDALIQNAANRQEDALEAVFSQIDWPRETSASFQVSEDTVLLDVDLPEIEDMPRCTFAYAKRQRDLVEKEKSETQIRKDYARHIHGIGFLLAGETFRTLPNIDNVVISGYS